MDDSFRIDGNNLGTILTQSLCNNPSEFIKGLMADTNPRSHVGIQFTCEEGVPKIKSANIESLLSPNSRTRQQFKNNGSLVRQKVLRFTQHWVDRNWSDFDFQDSFTLMDVKPLEIARQLTIIDHRLLMNISREDLLRCAGLRYNRDEGRPVSITQITERFNNVSRWVSTKVVTCQPSERIDIIFKFINIALNCWVLKIFSGTMAIVSGLKCGALNRYTSAWEHVNSSKLGKRLEELVPLATYPNKLRKIIDKVDQPAVPNLHAYLNHLAIITEGNASTINDYQINLARYEMIGRIFNKLNQFKSCSYVLVPLGVFQDSLESLPLLSDNELYEAAKLETCQENERSLLASMTSQPQHQQQYFLKKGKK
ncbi:hypothetical protein SAMD00019534_076360 [Acytostelium subglobosum LB1]|uniref:hypothetical protein n=1 Tax=Acytostelium subglobosum LB1 TaxID=1410327 RepID=UPI000644AD56|nr:hypothetical protein SAMD00019534_076360 [Acytostelium subglobosum LB1]GAM24461.1 hypothetical protein SAMD00019534_076360 [Acytostelium subglobosum LB1]|eukprot:XP_012752787.1 hypothetical protein SAMD00019534_076360 [Acytostelium subglobosum LB1]